MKTFEFHNPNADALVIPQEQGGTPDDTYFGSIGDATMKHVQNLCDADRQIWEGLLHMRSGAVFRVVPSTEMFDPDPLNLRGKDLQAYLQTFKDKGASESTLTAVREALELEAERREKSEDAYDKAELIPYSEWEKFPQQWNQIEMPTTPRDRYIYVGNTKQAFYDVFPEGHPDAAFINQVLNLLNRDWEEDITSSYGEWIKEKVIFSNLKAKGYTQRYLTTLVDGMVAGTDDPDDLAEYALSNIDRCWGIEFTNAVAAKAKKDKMLQVILFNEREWEDQSKKGINVYASVKAFGQALYADKEKMNAYLWDRYRRLKKLYAPKVMCRGFDINRCHPSDLMDALNLDRNEADKVWFARPFDNLGILYHKGYIKGKTFGGDETTDKVVTLLEQRAAASSESLDMRKFSAVRHLLMGWQRDKSYNLKPSQWRMIWEYYRLLKTDIQERINDGQEEGKTNVRA